MGMEEHGEENVWITQRKSRITESFAFIRIFFKWKWWNVGKIRETTNKITIIIINEWISYVIQTFWHDRNEIEHLCSWIPHFSISFYYFFPIAIAFNDPTFFPYFSLFFIYFRSFAYSRIITQFYIEMHSYTRYTPVHTYIHICIFIYRLYSHIYTFKYA